jgi:hypothetical protein
MFSRARVSPLLACILFAYGCGGTTAGAQPHDMSQAQHEAMASKEESTATTHSEQYNPAAKEEKEECTPAKRVCWTSITNPTDQHKEDAEKHKKMAADHRAAADALGSAEAQACAGLPDEDRDMSPFYHREDIAQVKEHVDEVRVGTRNKEKKTTGADIVFRAVPGMTTEWLQRIVDCHLARASAVGHEMPEMSYCPLVLKNVKAKVSSTGTGFAVAVTSEDPETVKEIIKRAKALVAPG